MRLTHCFKRFRLIAGAGNCYRSCSSSLAATHGFYWTPLYPTTAASPRRHQSSQVGRAVHSGDGGDAMQGTATMMHADSSKAEGVSFEQVWALWNEGNLFSLSVAQMQDFLRSVGVPTDATARKAAMVRRLEEYLHARDSAAATSPTEASPQQQKSGPGPHWANSALPPETLLDLAQSNFYEGAGSMVPKAFQLLTAGSVADMVVSRVNTAAFPGFPANTECYTLVAADAATTLQTRFSKVYQWCLLNMNNLQMDGELRVSLGKLLVDPKMMRRGESIVSSYTMQQRLQLNNPFTWVTAIPSSAVAVIEQFLTEQEGFSSVRQSSKKELLSALTYEAVIKRATDKLCVDMDGQGKLTALHSEWVNVQTVHHTRPRGPDIQLLLRSRAQVRRQDMETYQAFPIIELSSDDVQDVLPPEHGQLIYLSENETRRFERINDRGIVFSVLEVKRQPLIVLRDEEEDPRIEYSISVVIPASAGSRTMDVRAVGLEIFALADRMAAVAEKPFVDEYCCTTP